MPFSFIGLCFAVVFAVAIFTLNSLLSILNADKRQIRILLVGFQAVEELERTRLEELRSEFWVYANMVRGP
jgi:hypothetical protein